jgi:predicted O-methyltransferase YrrM
VIVRPFVSMKTFQQYALGYMDSIGAPIVHALWPRQPTWAVASISDMDAAFFAGLVIETRPAKLVEIGVASGWGSCVLLEALDAAGMQKSVLHGVDIAERFFYDEAYATGQCVNDVMPERLARYRLTTGMTAGECAASIGAGVDFAFIDAHHMHPWATLDLLAIMPMMRPASWVAMHDINLSRKEDQEHRNRGPKYLFEGWEGDKMHSTQVPTMAGAIRLPDDPPACLPLLLDILYTPWELPVDPRPCNAATDAVERVYGATWGAKFRRACEIGNYHVGKMHSADIDELHRKIAALRGGVRGWARALFRERNA